MSNLHGVIITIKYFEWKTHLSARGWKWAPWTLRPYPHKHSYWTSPVCQLVLRWLTVLAINCREAGYDGLIPNGLVERCLTSNLHCVSIRKHQVDDKLPLRRPLQACPALWSSTHTGHPQTSSWRQLLTHRHSQQAMVCWLGCDGLIPNDLAEWCLTSNLHRISMNNIKSMTNSPIGHPSKRAPALWSSTHTGHPPVGAN